MSLYDRMFEEMPLGRGEQPQFYKRAVIKSLYRADEALLLLGKTGQISQEDKDAVRAMRDSLKKCIAGLPKTWKMK